MNKVFLCIFLMLGSLCLSVADSNASITDYAYKAKLSLSNDMLRRVELPNELLVSLARQDLGDVTIFDRNGAMMPTWVRPRQIEVLRKSLSLKFNAFTGSSTDTARQETVTVVRDKEGRVEAYSKDSRSQLADEVLNAYIVELPVDDSEIRIDELNIQWTQIPARRLLSVRIEASDDLSKWRVLRSRQNLAKFENDANANQRLKINTSKKYLRISLNEAVDKFEIHSVEGHYREVKKEAIDWFSLGPMTENVEDPGFLSFSLSQKVRQKGARFSFNQPNQLIKGDIYRKEPNHDRRKLRYGGIVQHNITPSDEIEKNEPLYLQGSSRALWWFKPDQAIQSMPMVDLKMPNYELLFLANGTGPYSIAWGNCEAGAPMNSLKNVVDKDKLQKSALPLVYMMNIENSGGVVRLSVQEGPPYLKWFFWSVLVVIVLLTGRMAVKLFKDLGKKGI